MIYKVYYKFYSDTKNVLKINIATEVIIKLNNIRNLAYV